MRRVVTGHAPGGKAVVASDTHVEAVTLPLLPGLALHTLWGTERLPVVPDHGAPNPDARWFPEAGGFRFFHMVLPPDGELLHAPADQEDALAQTEARAPGLLATFDPDDPGMHRSDTVDCLYVLSGHPVLELDDGVEVALGPGDTVVQRGTRHRWHNRGRMPCTFVGVLVGAHRIG